MLAFLRQLCNKINIESDCTSSCCNDSKDVDVDVDLDGDGKPDVHIGIHGKKIDIKKEK